MSLMTTSEAARRTGVSGRTILRWLTSGELPGVQTPGGHWRVHLNDLNGFLAGPMSGNGSAQLAVVVVEDEQAEALALERLVRLMAPDSRIAKADNSISAGIMLGIMRPDVAFIDVEMPGFCGIDLIRRARELRELDSTRFVVVGGQLDEVRTSALRELGVVEILCKPLDPAAMQRILATCAVRPGFVRAA